MIKKRDLPLFGVLASVALFWLATASYPGGYRLAEHFVSTLFHARALDGANNPARYFALPAMLALCASVGAVFWSLAGRCPPGPLATTVRVGGVGAVVYAFLAVATPMHDLLVTVALAFFVAAVVATLRLAWLARQRGALLGGLVCLALVAASSAMYYGGVMSGQLAVAQKLTFGLGGAWLLAVHYTGLGLNRGAQDGPSEPTPVRGAA